MMDFHIFFNQELFGLPITNPKLQHFPFAVYIEDPSRFYPGYEAGYYCALFFYEGVINLIGLVVGYALYRKFKEKLKPGTVSLYYLGWYGLVRGSLEFLKIDNTKIGSSNVGMIQVMYIILLFWVLVQFNVSVEQFNRYPRFVFIFSCDFFSPPTKGLYDSRYNITNKRIVYLN